MYTQTQIPLLRRVFMDPLMVNVGNGVSQISDQKFKFDLDADGIEDEISMPTNKTGFLALDLNEDGKINDGSELFGTQSGDGFKDLAKYDSDGNGWIDENDDIFDRLSVWYKNGDGEDELIDLKEADIGAIYLGEQSTTFALKGNDMTTNGMIRSTGIFLHESTGLAGIIQHVDLAVNAKSGIAKEAEIYRIGEDDLVVYEEGSAQNGGYSSGEQVRENEENDRKSERESEMARRREKRLKKKQEEADRLERRREEKERLDELREKQIERKEVMDEKWEEKLEEKAQMEKQREEKLEEKAKMEEQREEKLEEKAAIEEQVEERLEEKDTSAEQREEMVEEKIDEDAVVSLPEDFEEIGVTAA